MKELKERQIKGEKHLAELTEAIDFISNKFEEYEKEGKKRKKGLRHWKSA